MPADSPLYNPFPLHHSYSSSRLSLMQLHSCIWYISGDPFILFLLHPPLLSCCDWAICKGVWLIAPIPDQSIMDFVNAVIISRPSHGGPISHTPPPRLPVWRLSIATPLIKFQFILVSTDQRSSLLWSTWRWLFWLDWADARGVKSYIWISNIWCFSKYYHCHCERKIVWQKSR